MAPSRFWRHGAAMGAAFVSRPRNSGQERVGKFYRRSAVKPLHNWTEKQWVARYDPIGAAWGE
jgi:hypothetical protein